LSYGRSV